MRRGSIFVIIFILVAGGIVGTSFFLRAQPPLELTVAVSPLASEWVRAAVNAFNATDPIVNATRRVRFTVETIDDLNVWLEDGRGWTQGSHPDAWIPAASFSVAFAREARMPLTMLEPTLARTLLVWGGFSDQVEAVLGDEVSLDWQAVASAAPRARLAFFHPARTAAGLAVLLSSAGDFHETTQPSDAELSSPDYRNWLRLVIEAVPNFNTLGTSVAETLAARGPSIGEIGLLPESDWLRNLRGQLVRPAGPLRLNYPAYNLVFEFPLARWSDPQEEDPDRRAGIEALGRWLLSAEQQTAAARYGLRSVDGQAEMESELFNRALAHGLQFEPAYQAVEVPSRNAIRTLLAWTSTVIR
ncbi:MAG: hypothetical protein SNJ59_12305 [Aggregatilineales bacterium]